MPQVNLFISTVTAEFREYRDVLVKRLTRHNVSVKVQEDFIDSGGTLLLKLDDYIRHCDAVIHLAGDATGAAAHPIDVEDLVKRYPDLGTRLRGVIDVAPNAGHSYTQWEAYLAIYHGRSLFIACPTPIAEREPGFTKKRDDVAAQQEHLKRLERLARYPGIRFDDAKDLLVEVLRSDINQLLPKDKKPIVLPYISLGNLFKGRDAFMEDLHASLHAPRAATAIVGKAVHGLGGIGKTRLAVEYAWRYAEHYAAVLFVSAETPSSLQANLAALVAAKALDLPEKNVTEEEVRRDAVVRWLQDHPGWLLIFDNIDTKPAADAVEALLADLHGGHVLITARYNQFSAAIEKMKLDVLAEDDAVAFLLERTQNERRPQSTDPDDARALAKELGGLALALEQAGAYIAKNNTTFSAYLAAWRAHDLEVQEFHDATLMQYPREIKITFDLTLRELGPGEIALLRLLAWFAPEPIPDFIFKDDGAEKVWREQAELLAANAPDAAAKIKTLRKAANESANYSMLQRDPETGALSIHRVLQEILRTGIPEDDRTEWLTVAMRFLSAAAPAAPDDVRTWPKWDPLRPHTEALACLGDESGIAVPTWSLMNQLGVLLTTKALYSETERFSRRALDICDGNYSTNHPKVAVCLNNLALLLHVTNRYSEAEPLMRRALEIDERSFGHEHPKVARDLNNLAQLLQNTNRFSEAECLMRRTLEIDEKSYGLEHPEVATDLNNLASLLQATNRLSEAEPLLRRALEIAEKSFGHEHPDVAIYLNNLAQLLQATKRLSEAEPLMRRNVVIFLKFTKRTGHDHFHLRTCLDNYCDLLQAMSRTEAEILTALRALLDEHGVRLA